MKDSSKRKPRPHSRRLLNVIILVFIASAAVRLAGAGQAIANDLTPTEDASETPAISEIISEMNARRERLDLREKQIETRMQALILAQNQLELQTQALVKAEQELSATMATAKSAASDDLASLTSMYESMKPKQAVPLFEEMAPEFAAGFLSRMKPEASAQILAGMDPKTAYAISVVLAGRNSNVPTE